MRILLYVQSLLGRGHLVRAANLARALSRDFEIFLIDGGGSVPFVGDVKRASLPIIRSDIGFTELVDGAGLLVDEHYKQRRRDLLLRHYDDFCPDIVIVESYPLARRGFAFELEPLLLKAGADKVLRICSVRDILVFDGNFRKQESILQKLKNIDRVWVHGDKEFCALERSMPFASEFCDKIIYSGYIAPEVLLSERVATNRVVVSGGGGAAALLFYQQLLVLAEQLPQYEWLFLLGENFGVPDFGAGKPSYISCEHNSADFHLLLQTAKVSISQAGYNTVMDIILCGAPSLLLAFTGEQGAESEQPLRATLLQDLGRVKILPQDLSELSSEDLASMIETEASKGILRTAPFFIADARHLNQQIHALWRQHVG